MGRGKLAPSQLCMRLVFDIQASMTGGNTSDSRSSSSKKDGSVKRTLGLAIIIGAVGLVFIALTNGLGSRVFPTSLESHRSHLTSAEVALFGVIFIELLVKAALQHHERQNARQLGIMVRAVVRTIGYMVIAIAILSILASNPALAVGVGSMMGGLIVGFATQNIIGNVFAGMFLAVGRPFRIDDEITVSGNTGRVIEITAIHTMIEAQEGVVLVPNASMLTQIILRRKAFRTSD
jgi:small conductance mechanosensitive channel